MKPNVGDAVWLAARDRNGELRRGRCVNRRLVNQDEWLFWVETPDGAHGAYEAHRLYETREAAEAAFSQAAEESRKRSAAMPPIETSPPKVGHAKLDALIEAAWGFGYQSATADDGCGDYPTVAEVDEIRRLAREIIERGLL